jgi:hypothetical protein
MRLFLEDIKHYAFQSDCNRTITPKTIYYDGINHITELSQKTFLRNNDWRLNARGDNGCVYFLVEKEEVVYIGQTINKTRIKQHEKDKTFDSVWFVPCKIPYQIRLEEMLLSKYVTKYNKRYNEKKIQKKVSELFKPKYYITEQDIQNIYLNL